MLNVEAASETQQMPQFQGSVGISLLSYNTPFATTSPPPHS